MAARCEGDAVAKRCLLRSLPGHADVRRPEANQPCCPTAQAPHKRNQGPKGGGKRTRRIQAADKKLPIIVEGAYGKRTGICATLVVVHAEILCDATHETRKNDDPMRTEY